MTAPPAKLTLPMVVPLARAYYENHRTGGILHIVLDDGNLEDGHMRWCLERARLKGDIEAGFLAMLVMALSPSQRRRLVNAYQYA